MNPQAKQRKTLPKEVVKQKLRERKKNAKELLKQKRARLVVKNLSFKVTEEKLQEFFGQYGDISSIEILKRPDGKLIGCAFIQFKVVQKAAKARHHTNGKEFLGRTIEVDFAKPKNKYKQESQKANINDEKITTSENVAEQILDNDVKIEIDSDTEMDDIKKESDSEESEEDKASESEEDKASESEDDLANGSEDDMASESEQEYVNTIDEKNNPHFSHDVAEGKTVFVKNIPFNATNDDLKQCMAQFGRIYYALICIDKLTEHSKGTGFVKFVNKEDAEKALSAGTELKLLNNILDCHPAIDNKAVHDKVKNKETLKKQPKDSRNLYLVKEGVISPGSSAAQGVSSTDMAKRAQIEQYKTQMLRKLNMYVSNDRLVVHNLPASWDDQKLRTLFQKYGGPGAVVREARVMRDRKNVDSNGVGISKQYGFVAFTKHENALTALRSLNNNPDIFSVNKRPIIVFSIENKSAILAKQKRMEKSKVQNQSKEKPKDPNSEKKTKSKKFRQFLEKKRIAKMKGKKTPQKTETTKFSGHEVHKKTRKK